MSQEPNPPTALDATTLRAVAELASSLREGPRWIVVRQTKQIDVCKIDPGLIVGAVVIPVDTPPVGKQPTVEYAKIGAMVGGGMKDVDLLKVPDPRNPEEKHRADAVFWSEAAVEKFLLPYYASKHLHEGGLVADAIVQLFHRPTRPRQDAPAGDDVFALVHVPTSEYVPADDAEGDASPVRGLFAGVVVKDANGQPADVELVSVAELLRRRREPPRP